MTFPEYHKIQSIYKRDERGSFILGEWSTPEIAYLSGNDWTWTEKVDGTNIRIGLDADGTYRVGGRTERASIPATLLDSIQALGLEKKLREQFTDGPVTLYGEGYGAGIQKGGGNYRQDKGFVLFDCLVGKWWLTPSTVDEVGAQLGLDVVPTVGHGTLLEAQAVILAGFRSRWGDFKAEGIVARPTVPMWDRKGDRIITKVKGVDFT
jgi:hypothetical protein